MAQANEIHPQLRRGRLAEERGPRPPRIGSGRPHYARGKATWRGVFVHAPRAGVVSQKVIVKTRVMKSGWRGYQSLKAIAQSYVAYIEKEGIDAHAQGQDIYTRIGEEEDVHQFAERVRQNDPHFFHIVVSPEYGKDLDMTQFTRIFMAQVDKDVGARTDWIAANHYDTSHPHSHILVRGRDTDGKELGLKPDYLCHGMPYRAQDIATEMLGHRREHQIERTVERARDIEVDHELER